MIGLTRFRLSFGRQDSGLANTLVVAAGPQPRIDEAPRTRREVLEEELLQAEQALRHTAQTVRHRGGRSTGAEVLEADWARVMRLRLELQAMRHSVD